MNLGLDGKVAMVAAATSGLGLAVATELAAEGARVAICGRDPGRLAAAQRAVSEAGTAGPAHATRLDVRDEAATRAWVETVTAHWGGPHIVVTNGAGPPPGPPEEFTVKDYRDAVETSMLPHIGLVLSALPALRAAGWGRILMIASETVREPIPRYSLSGTARLGLLGFARSLVSSLGAAGVTVNVLAPGYHHTPALDRQFGAGVEEALARIGREIPLGRVGRPEELAAAAAFLASERASFITGTLLLVNGGATRGTP